MLTSLLSLCLITHCLLTISITLFFTTPKWLLQLWSRLKHVSFKFNYGLILIWPNKCNPPPHPQLSFHVSLVLPIGHLYCSLINVMKFNCKAFWILLQQFRSFKVGFCAKAMNNTLQLFKHHFCRNGDLFRQDRQANGLAWAGPRRPTWIAGFKTTPISKDLLKFMRTLFENLCIHTSFRLHGYFLSILWLFEANNSNLQYHFPTRISV